MTWPLLRAISLAIVFPILVASAVACPNDHTANLVVLDVDISTGPGTLDKDDTVPIECVAVPDPEEIGGTIYWYVSEGPGGGTFGDNAESTTFTGTHAGTGRITVDYWYGGQFASASVPFTVNGASIDTTLSLDDELVFSMDDGPGEVSCNLHPADAGAVYYWSVDSGGGGAWRRNGRMDYRGSHYDTILCQCRV